ncbi:MAG: hypothetical protein GT589_03775 [Peptoclostridium sp.]|nr:hypothetical protein [Peptoclostridium sp.]MZQ75260.1 hypothetical protein [Peptoclostridium sp.]
MLLRRYHNKEDAPQETATEVKIESKLTKAVPDSSSSKKPAKKADDAK